MINFRYHIVSITAVFLALGIGTALGSTFLDRYTVDLLDRNISSAEARIKATDAENDRLQSQVDDAEARDGALLVSGAPQMLDDRLPDVPVLVVAAAGVDGAAVDAVELVLGATGADLRGSLLLTDKLAFADGVDAELADALGLQDPDVRELRAAVEDQLANAMLAAAVVPDEQPEPTTTTTAPTTTADPGATTSSTSAPATTSTTTAAAPDGEPAPSGPDGTQPDVLTTLLERGYVRFDPAAGVDAADPLLEVPGYRYVLVSQAGLEPSANEVLLSLLPTGVTDGILPAVVVSPSVPPRTDPDAPEPEPSAVATVREDDDLAARYGTVDQVETFAGQVATVLSVDRLGAAKPGHYGQADGAEAIVPPPP
ncbi:MAG: copper transporter [Acidimicrobiales bacterium]